MPEEHWMDALQNLSDSVKAKDLDKASVAQAMLKIANKRISTANSLLLQMQASWTKLQSRKCKLEGGNATESLKDAKRQKESASTLAKKTKHEPGPLAYW